MTYLQLLSKLNAHAETDFAAFQRKLIFTKQEILGVRTPILRKIAKETAQSVDIQTLLSFPDTYYEITFIKLACVSALPYERFINYVESCVALIDNWATCDCFKAKCITKNQDKFLPVLQEIFRRGGEFDERFVLVTLLYAYVEEKYIPLIKQYLKQANTSYYYVHMAAAWLTAELIVKLYDVGVSLLQSGVLDKKTHNKAIQKSIESYRITKEQKEYLRSLKIK